MAKLQRPLSPDTTTNSSGPYNILNPKLTNPTSAEPLKPWKPKLAAAAGSSKRWEPDDICDLLRLI